MLALERRNLILEKLQEDKKVVVSSLSRQFKKYHFFRIRERNLSCTFGTIGHSRMEKRILKKIRMQQKLEEHA